MRIRRKNDLNLRTLEIFGATMRNQATVSAAEELGISQPAVSNAIRALEKQLDMVLFERSNRGLTPTAEAHLIYEEIEPIFMMMRNIEEQVRATRAAKAGRLRLMATPPLSQTIIPQALKQFLATRKNVRVTYDIRSVSEILRELESGATDVGLLLGMNQHPSFDVIELHQGEMACMLPADHPLSSQAALTPADIARHSPLGLGLDHESTLGALVRSAFASQGERFESNLEVRYCHSACVLANAGLGVAIVDSFTAKSMETPELVRRQFVPRIEVTASAVVRSDRTVSRVTSAFIDEIRETLVNSDR